MRLLLGVAALLALVTPQVQGAVHYKPEGASAVCVNGTTRYNRALYGAHSGFRMECSDTPVFGVYLPTMGGHLEFDLPQGDCRAVYTPGRMDYDKGGVKIEAQVLRSDDVALWRLTNTTGSTVTIPVTFGGVSGKKFSREGDLGVDPADCFDLKPQYCTDNVFDLKGSRLTVEYGSKQRKKVCLIIPATRGEITPDNIYKGVLTLAPGKSCTVAYFPDEEPMKESLDALMARAETERAQLASSLTINTPDEWLNPVGGALAVAADGIWSGSAWLHGSIGWRTPHLGWRGAYCGDALGWHDRALTHFVTYADNQITDIPATMSHPRQDRSLNMARAEKKWGTPMYSNGYICRRPGKKNEMSHYDMNMVYADAMLRHFMHTGDTASMRRLYPVLKRHLAWEKLNFDPDGDHLYDAYCCIWASDALYYSGGAVTHSSAYNYFANLMAARVAEAIGEDATPYREEAEAIAKAIDSQLWMHDKGCWAEYRDLGGHERLHPYPAVWTIYHAVDSRLGDEFQRYAATSYIDREIPRIPVREGGDSLYVISTTNWKPYSWSINNVAIAEEMHTALAYWQAGRPDDAFRLMKGVIIDNMYTGACPLNFGQISQYDAARGECYRDFADPVGVWSRALTEGLYGICPDMLSADKSVTVSPGFPSHWSHASISAKDISYSFNREGNVDTYVLEPRYAADTKLSLHVPALGLSRITVDGKPADWELIENSIGEPRVAVSLPDASGKKTVRVYREASRSGVPTGAVRTEGPVRFTEMASGLLKWWAPSQAPSQTDASVIAIASERTGEFDKVEASKCETVDLTPYFNASVTDIFGNEYLSPRPEVTTLQIPVQGIGEWCHPKLTAIIDDYKFRELARKGEGKVSLLDIPFATPAEGNNILFTTLWDNYPTAASVPLAGNASHIYMLMAGSTNHMQWGMENARLTVAYADGSEHELPLVNPVNWAPIEQDFYTDSYAFAQPADSKLPYRVHLQSGEASRTLGKSLDLKGPYERNVPGGAAIMIDIPVDPAKALKSLKLETMSHDVVTGIMGVSLQRP